MFEYDLKQKVTIECSGETGVVVGRAEYERGLIQYHIRYKAADGRAVEDWWPSTSLCLAID